MPPAARSGTTRGDTTRSDPTPGAEPPSAATTEAGAATTEASAAAGEATDTGAGLARSMGHIVTLPVTVARVVADDIASTARRPDAVLYWGGLVGLAALGVLEWPAAAAVGVGVAIASGRRRARTAQPVG
jgi:hypothetical protein